jgi:hypothetical protein
MHAIYIIREGLGQRKYGKISGDSFVKENFITEII